MEINLATNVIVKFVKAKFGGYPVSFIELCKYHFGKISEYTNI